MFGSQPRHEPREGKRQIQPNPFLFERQSKFDFPVWRKASLLAIYEHLDKILLKSSIQAGVFRLDVVYSVENHDEH